MSFARQEDVNDILYLHQIYKGSKYFFPRSRQYIWENYWNYICSKVGGILQGSAELISLDETIIELWAFVIIPKITWEEKISITQWIINFSIKYCLKGNKKLISVTANSKLQEIYAYCEWKEAWVWKYIKRKQKSIWSKVYEFN